MIFLTGRERMGKLRQNKLCFAAASFPYKKISGTLSMSHSCRELAGYGRSYGAKCPTVVIILNLFEKQQKDVAEERMIKSSKVSNG